MGQRYEGYRRALNRHGIALDPRLVLPTAFAEGSARTAVEALLNLKVRFDALFASSDLLAMRSIGTLRSHGLRVPDDVAVVGYDDIELAQHIHPSLTTIRQPMVNGAEALVNALLLIIEGKHPQSQVLATRLIVRDSSAKRS